MTESTTPVSFLRRVPVRFAGAALGLAVALWAAAAPAATPEPAAHDEMVHPEFLEQYAATLRFRNGKPAEIEIPPAGDAVLFLRSGPRSPVRDLFVFDPATGEERRLLTAETLLGGGEEELTAEEQARRERMRLAARGIATYALSADGEQILAPLSDRLFLVERRSGAVREIEIGDGFPLDPQLSPDAGQVAYVVDGDLYVAPTTSAADAGGPRRLTVRDGATVTHGLAEFVAQEEMNRYHGFWWSPDGRHLAYQRTDTAGMEVFRIADPADPSRPPQEWPYPRPGQRNADVRLGVVPAAGGDTVWVEWDRERYPYLAAVAWPAGAPLTLLVQNREQSEEVLLAADPATGATRTLLVERDAAWLNLDDEMPHWLPGGGAFLWTTERNGAWQLELRGKDGALIHALTPPELGYRGFAGFDRVAEQVFVHAGADPTESHLYRVPLAGGEPVQLTSAPGEHDVTFSEDGRLSVDAFESLTGPPRWIVRDAGGAEIGELRSLQEQPAFPVTPELAVVGEERFRAAVQRPNDFDPALRYPVVLYVYGGPHRATVTRKRDDYIFDQWLADQGFVVVRADGRGTPHRGREWERAIRFDFIDLPLADQSAAVRALGERFPEMDLERLGVYGWSFGGYFSAMAVMRRGDLFRAAVAGAPVADWHDYDTHYTERYVGLPQDHPEAYARSSVLTYAPQLERPLLIVHGTADDNVYFMHSLKMSDALFRAGRAHEFLPLAGFTHMVRDPLVTERLYGRVVGFLEEHLGNPVPAAENGGAR